MSGNADLLVEIGRLEAMLEVAMRTLGQIATAPRNKGAKQNANGTLRFLETQMADIQRASNAKLTSGANTAPETE